MILWKNVPSGCGVGQEGTYRYEYYQRHHNGEAQELFRFSHVRNFIGLYKVDAALFRPRPKEIGYLNTYPG
jgi:hypothetical protein